MSLSVLKKITFFIVIIVIILMIFFLKSIVEPILFSILLAYILNPFVKYLSGKGINKRLAAISIIIILFAFFTFIIFFIIPGMMKDLLGAISSLDKYGEKITEYINNSGYNTIPKYMRQVLDNNILKFEGITVKYLNELFKQIINFGMELPTYILAPVFIYYFLIDTDFFLNLIKILIPVRARVKTIELGREMDKIIGGFIRSQLILSLIVMVLTFIVLVVFKIKFPIVIAFINGVANIIPYFGPIIGLFPAFIAALSESTNKAIMIGIAFLILQEIESSVIAPKVMGESIGMHPVFVMIVLLIGGKFFGAWGLIFSIPVGGIIKVSWNYLIRSMY
jgi:predicted PurR-regulated permease PerM